MPFRQTSEQALLLTRAEYLAVELDELYEEARF
jgi:hypothetical protein